MELYNTCVRGKMRKQARTLIYDKLHKGVVLTCVGLTLYGTVILGDFVYRHFMYVRPKIQAAKEAAEKELLSEGAADKMLLKD
ncbi:uncharacterized protein LOC105380415 [Plutella xylostella]|uniref:uncharacterized protein LOC105380415 n=1 Tax=Plutella xylostella TaxID=51655 RepID=UPI0020330E90|nr:uncharacterized protein LOC105380415 [Plutella xylostella]